MRATYRVLGIAISVMVVLQASFIAFGVFDVRKQVDDNGSIGEDAVGDIAGFGLHSLGAMVVSLLVIALLIVSFFVKVPGAIQWAAIVFGVTLLQWILAIFAFPAPIVGLLHGINAFAIAGTASVAARKISQAAPEPVATATA
jgi:hypothetical protein